MLSSLRPKNIWSWLTTFWLILFIYALIFAFDNIENNIGQDIQISSKNLINRGNINFQDNPFPNSELPLIAFQDSQRGFAALGIDLSQGIKTGILEVTVDPGAQVWKNFIYFRVKSYEYDAAQPNQPATTHSLGFKSDRWTPLKGNNLVYQLPLYEDHLKYHLELQILYRGNLPGIPINSIRIKPATLFDFTAGGFILSALVILSTFLPGLVLIFIQKRTVLPLPVTAFLYSQGLNICSLILCQALNIPSYFFIVLIVLTLITSLLISRTTRHSEPDSNWNYRHLLPELNIWVLCLFLISIAACFLFPNTIANLHQGHSGLHTFGAFKAHDSVLQFANSQSILLKEFDTLYGPDAIVNLLVKPEYREILPGILYAATTLFLQTFLPEPVASSYYPYFVYYLICHALFLSMVFAWLRPLNHKLAYVATFFIATTPVFWVINILGWFKLTGAALLIAGVYLIRKKPEALKYWIFAGLLFGLSKNFHGGNVLLLPMIALWLIGIVYLYEKPFSLSKLLGHMTALTVAACLVIFPWNIYTKLAWDTGTHRLFSMHFLHNHYDPKSLTNSVIAFFEKTPWSEQFDVRIERMLNLFDLSFISAIFSGFQNSSDSLIEVWLRVSASFTTPSVLPYLILATIIVIISKINYQQKSQYDQRNKRWISQFAWLQFICILIIAFATYGPVNGYPITWNSPILPFLMLIIGAIVFSWKYSAKALPVWSALGFIQLGFILTLG